MLFSKIKIQKVKENIHPIFYYESELARRISGTAVWVDAGICPFHSDKSKGSFFVNQLTGAYKCHSCGIGGGDIIDFHMKHHSYDFRTALTEITSRFREVK